MSLADMLTMLLRLISDRVVVHLKPDAVYTGSGPVRPTAGFNLGLV